MRLAAKAANAGSSNPRQPTPKRVRHPVEGAGERLPPAVVRLVGLRQVCLHSTHARPCMRAASEWTPCASQIFELSSIHRII